jgi:hypothetical protein
LFRKTNRRKIGFRAADIQKQTSAIVISGKEIFWRNSEEEKVMKS